MAATELDIAKLKRAIVTLRARVDESPKNGEAAVALAEALLRLSLCTAEPAKQVEYLDRACELDPYDTRLRLALGAARRRAGEIRGALDAFGASAAIDPRDPRPWVAIGMTLVAHYRASPEAKPKVVDRAIEAFDKAIALDPSSSALQAAKLYAACHMRVPGPERSRFVKLLPATLKAIQPARELVPFASWLMLSIAYAIHFPKHAATKNPQDKLSEADLAARTKAFSGLSAGLDPWLEAFADEPRLRMVRAAIGVLSADLADAGDEAAAKARTAAFADRVAEAAAVFPDRWLFHLVVHQKLEEIADPTRRLDLSRALAARLQLAIGLDRELLSSLNMAARAALLDGRMADAEKLWRDGIAVDRYCSAFHHNLALLALHRRDAAGLASHMRNAAELTLVQWCIQPDRADVLDRLAARHESFAIRLRKTVEAALERADGGIDPEVIGAWVGEAQASLLVRGVAVAMRRGVAPTADQRASLVEYLREVPAVADPGRAIPAALAMFFDLPPSAQPPFHYDTIGIAPDAPHAEVVKKLADERERYARMMGEALRAGERDAAMAIRRRLSRVEEAASVLGDQAQRDRYDSECLPAFEHALHTARWQLVTDLLDFATKLVEKGSSDLVPLLVRAYRQTPHEHLDAYFESRQANSRAIIRTNMTSIGVKDLLDRAQEHMGEERWKEAHDLLTLAVSAGADTMRYLHYLLAVCELKLELAHIRKNSVPSAAGVDVKSTAREALAKMGGSLEGSSA